MNKHWTEIVKGETLLGVSGGSDTITLTTDKHVVTLRAYGDCCSSSWFEHCDEVGAIGGQIVEFTNDPMPEGNFPDNVGDEYFSYDFVTLRTTKGRVHIEMRNSSNGYYSGYIDVDVVDAAN